jgi:RimJ/RimL family protein N-acetyltransferase
MIETERLTLRKLDLHDAAFIFELVNEPSFVRFIGDKGVRTLEDAREYLRKGPLDSYARYGFGLYLVSLKDGTPIGMCGLVKREALEDVDIGFAYLPRFHSQGYAFESAAAVMSHAKRHLGITRLAGVTKPDNAASIRVLEKLGLALKGTVKIDEDGPDNKLFLREL